MQTLNLGNKNWYTSEYVLSEFSLHFYIKIQIFFFLISFQFIHRDVECINEEKIT